MVGGGSVRVGEWREGSCSVQLIKPSMSLIRHDSVKHLISSCAPAVSKSPRIMTRSKGQQGAGLGVCPCRAATWNTMPIKTRPVFLQPAHTLYTAEKCHFICTNNWKGVERGIAMDGWGKGSHIWWLIWNWDHCESERWHWQKNKLCWHFNCPPAEAKMTESPPVCSWGLCSKIKKARELLIYNLLGLDECSKLNGVEMVINDRACSEDLLFCSIKGGLPLGVLKNSCTPGNILGGSVWKVSGV